MPKTLLSVRLPTMAAIICLGGMASPSVAKVTAGGEVAVNGRVSSNPFNLPTDKSVVIAVTPRIAPWLRYEDTDTKIEAQGDASVDQYTRIYGRTTTLTGRLNLEQAVSPRLSVNGGLEYFNSNSGVQNALLARTAAADAVPPPSVLLPDASTAGRQSRNQSVTAFAGASLQLSALDSLSISGSAAQSHTDAAGRSDFANQTGFLTYSRKISSRTSIVASASYSNADYLHTAVGDGRVFSPRLGIAQQLTQRINLDVSLGASFSNVAREGGRRENFTILSGSLRLCNAIDRGAACLNAARVAQATALGSISTTTDVSLGVDRALGRSNSIAVSARYSSVKQSFDSLGRSSDFAGVDVHFTHKFSERLFAFVSPTYSKAFGQLIASSSNFDLRAGVRYRFGAI